MPARGGAMRRLPPYLLELCRQMRQRPTTAEAWLWSCLRSRRFGGYKFRRQRPLGRYIADFSCDEARLIIELDGGVHERQAEYDAARDAYLAASGYRTLRIANEEVTATPEVALLRIMTALSDGSSPSKGEGSSTHRSAIDS